MEWIMRGSGRSYDSLSETGAILGLLSKKVISHTTLNRKCRKCDRGYPPTDHESSNKAYC